VASFITFGTCGGRAGCGRQPVESRLTDTDDIYYGLALMRSKMAHGCMLTSVSIAQAAVEGRLPGGPGLRLVDLGPDFDPMMEHRHLRPAGRAHRLRRIPSA
jgi:hypothetical protein